MPATRPGGIRRAYTRPGAAVAAAGVVRIAGAGTGWTNSASAGPATLATITRWI